jgi:GGDEF domain-containing protein
VATRVPRGAAGSLAERVRHAVTFSLPWKAASIDVRGSVGVVVSQEHSGPSLVAAADAAMYEAKLVR